MSPQPGCLMESSIVVSDLPRARAFYQRVLGLPVVIEEAGMVGLQVPGGAVLLLHDRANVPPAGGVDDVAHLRFGVGADSLPEWGRHLMLHGIVIESRMQTGGAASLFFRDPDHHALELVAEPG